MRGVGVKLLDRARHLPSVRLQHPGRVCDLSDIEVFTRVVETKSFTAAADLLKVSKATTSKHISAIEQRFGVGLINRTTRSFSVTDAGARFYAHCRQILADIENAEAEVLELSSVLRGRLRISAPASFGHICIAPQLRQFLELYPNIDLDLSFSDETTDFVRQGCDLAIRVTRMPPKGMHGVCLSGCVHLVCAAPEYVAQHGQPAHPEELVRHCCLAYAHGLGGEVWQLTGPRGPVSVRVDGRLRADNGDALRAVLLAGGGLAIMPKFLVAPDLRAGRLVDALPGYIDRSYAVYAFQPRRNVIAPKVQAFVAFLRERFAENPDCYVEPITQGINEEGDRVSESTRMQME